MIPATEFHLSLTRVAAAGGFAGIWFATIDFVLLERDLSGGLSPAIAGFSVELVLAGALFGAVAWVAGLLLRLLPRCYLPPATGRGLALFILLAGTLLALGGNRANGGVIWLEVVIVLLPAIAISFGWFGRQAPEGRAVLEAWAAVALGTLLLGAWLAVAVSGSTLSWRLAALIHFVGAAALMCAASLWGWWTALGRIARTTITFAPALVIGALFFASTLVRDPPPLRTPAQKNVILITLDALRRDHLGLYGARRPTPRIDAFFSDGVIFERSFSPSSWTLPSMIALFSERVPREGGGQPSHRVSLDATPLAEVLNRRGYSTTALVGSYLLGRSSGTLRGMQRTLVLNHHRRRDELFGAPWLVTAFHDHLRSWWAPDRRYVDTTRLLVDEARATLVLDRRVPFFLWLHLMSPHDPYDPPPDWVKDNYQGRLPPATFAPHDEFPSELDMREQRFVTDAADRAHIAYLYALEVAYMDRLLGTLFDTFEALGLANNTIVALTSDHGEELWDHGDYYHGQSMHDELIGVPLLLRIPGAEARRLSETVSTIALLPTLRALLQIAPDPGADWPSLDPLLADQPLRRPPVYSFEHARGLYALRDDQFSVLWNASRNSATVFDAQKDRLEMSELTNLNPETVDSYVRGIKQWRTGSGNPQRVSSPGGSLDDQRERLKALGYLK